MKDRLFIGVYPAGIVYSDRANEQHGDYKRLAFLPYRELSLKLEPDCPADIVGEIRFHAQSIVAQRGQKFFVSACQQTVTLGK